MKGFCHRSLLFTRTDKKGTTEPIDIISQIPLNNISKINNHELIKKMHKDILSKSKIKKVCTLTDGVRVLNKIEEINKVRI